MFLITFLLMPWQFYMYDWATGVVSCYNLFPIDLNAFLMITKWVARLCFFVSWRMSYVLYCDLDDLLIISCLLFCSAILLIWESFIGMIGLRVFFSVLHFVFNWLECVLDDYYMSCSIVFFVTWRISYAFYCDFDDSQLMSHFLLNVLVLWIFYMYDCVSGVDLNVFSMITTQVVWLCCFVSWRISYVFYCDVDDFQLMSRFFCNFVC